MQCYSRHCSRRVRCPDCSEARSTVSGDVFLADGGKYSKCMACDQAQAQWLVCYHTRCTFDVCTPETSAGCPVLPDTPPDGGGAGLAGQQGRVSAAMIKRLVLMTDRIKKQKQLRGDV